MISVNSFKSKVKKQEIVGNIIYESELKKINLDISYKYNWKIMCRSYNDEIKIYKSILNDKVLYKIIRNKNGYEELIGYYK